MNVFKNLVTSERKISLGQFADYLKDSEKKMGEVAKDSEFIPDFLGLLDKVDRDVLDFKTQEMIYLALAIALRCEGCIITHGQRAAEAGVTLKEAKSVIEIATMMQGGPGLSYGVKAYQVMKEFASDN